MEKNTVILSIQDYNELRDIKEAVEKRKKIFLKHGWMHDNIPTFFFASENDLNNIFISENKKLSEQLEKVQNEFYEFRHPNKKQPSIDEVKSMNLFQLIKWRLSK